MRGVLGLSSSCSCGTAKTFACACMCVCLDAGGERTSGCFCLRRGSSEELQQRAGAGAGGRRPSAQRRPADHQNCWGLFWRIFQRWTVKSELKWISFWSGGTCYTCYTCMIHHVFCLRFQLQFLSPAAWFHYLTLPKPAYYRDWNELEVKLWSAMEWNLVPPRSHLGLFNTHWEFGENLRTSKDIWGLPFIFSKPTVCVREAEMWAGGHLVSTFLSFPVTWRWSAGL